MLPFYGISFLFHLVLIQEDHNKVGKKKRMLSWFSKVTCSLERLKSLVSYFEMKAMCIAMMNNSIRDCAIVLSNTGKGQPNKRDVPDWKNCKTFINPSIVNTTICGILRI